MEKTKKTVIAVAAIASGIALVYYLTGRAEAAPGEWPPPNPADPTKATAYGVVFNESYITYPNITVEYRLLGDGVYYTTVTNSEGRYVLENIEPGPYHVQLYTSAGVPCGYIGSAYLPAGEATSVNVITTLG